MKGRKLMLMLATVGCISIMSACGGSSDTTDEQSTQEIQSIEFPSQSDNEAEGSLSVSDDQADNQADNQIEEVAVQDESDVIESSESDNNIEAASDNAAVEEVAEAEAKEDAINWDDIEAFDKAKAMYATTDVKVRKGPDTSFDVLKVLKLNEEVSVIGKSKSTPWLEIAIGDEKAFVHGDYFQDEKIDLEALMDVAAAENNEAPATNTEPIPEASAEVVATPEPTPAPTPVPSKPAVAPAGVLFIGDSRTCQMQASTGGGKCKWICEYGSKYDWFSGTAVPAADAMIGSGTKVVICMGINDPENYDSYISLVNGKAIDWTGRGAKVYYVSLNPVDSPYDFKNYAIDVFNSEVPSRLGNVKWIDTASALKQSGYTLEDGIHYDTATNIKIYNLICGSL